MRRHPSLQFWKALLCLLVLGTIHGYSAEPSTESKVKAAFLYNFAKFVEWPTSSLPAHNRPFTFCTAGDNTTEGSLEEALQGKTIDGHPLVSRHIKSLAFVEGCQVLFVTKAKGTSTLELPTNSNWSGLLTVTETETLDKALRSGAVITLILQSNRVRFVIDTRAAERSGLAISSKLLSLALEVQK